MTEQEFRDALKKRVDNTGLSSDRQYQVLARMKGGRRTVRIHGKIKIVLVLILVLGLGVTGAVAGGLGGVDWYGEPAQPPLNIPLNSTETGARMEELRNVPEKSLVTVVVNLSPEPGEIGGIMGMSANYYASSLEEMKAWVEADGTLAWPVVVPEGYRLKLGRVAYSCDAKGGMRLISKETTEDGFLTASFELLEEHRFMSNYFMRLINDAGQELAISVSLDYGNGMYTSFAAGEDSEVTTLQVDGMLNTILITTPQDKMLAMRRNLDQMKIYYTMDMSLTGHANEYEEVFHSLTRRITTTDLDMTAADLLAIFGLETQ